MWLKSTERERDTGGYDAEAEAVVSSFSFGLQISRSQAARNAMSCAIYLWRGFARLPSADDDSKACWVFFFFLVSLPGVLL